MRAAQNAETRSDRRKRRNRQALIEAGYRVMAEKGIDAATMSEICELADVGAGTVYNYFASKDELAMCVMEQVMDRLSQRIEAVTNSFTDPAQVYAFGIRNVMKAATTDQRWRWLLRRSEVISDAMYRVMGPYAIRDIRNAVATGRYRVEDPELAWRQATHAIVGFSWRCATRTFCRARSTRRLSICWEWSASIALKPGKSQSDLAPICPASSHRPAKLRRSGDPQGGTAMPFLDRSDAGRQLAGYKDQHPLSSRCRAAVYRLPPKSQPHSTPRWI